MPERLHPGQQVETLYGTEATLLWWWDDDGLDTDRARIRYPNGTYAMARAWHLREPGSAAKAREEMAAAFDSLLDAVRDATSSIKTFANAFVDGINSAYAFDVVQAPEPILLNAGAGA